MMGLINILPRIYPKQRIHSIIRNFHPTSFFLQNELHNEISLDNSKVGEYLENLREEFYNLRVKSNANERDIQRMNKLSSIVTTFEQKKSLEKNLESLNEIDGEKDSEMKELVKEEREVYTELLRNIEIALKSKLLTVLDSDEFSSIYFEINSGAGGQEAMLFADELFGMYEKFLDYKNWDYEVLHLDRTDIGGLRHATLLIHNENAYSTLRYEGGVHRVQRVPATEKSGRIHTSTVSVAIIPQPNDIETVINDKDVKIETKRASGAGGQHVNTTDSAVRIVHIPTGIVVECQTERSQIKNKEIAFKKLESKLFRLQFEAQEATKTATKKSQVGSINRNEKIRTYNFPQNRITDHRIKGGTIHNVEEFLRGGAVLETFIAEILNQKRKEEFLNIILNSQ